MRFFLLFSLISIRSAWKKELPTTIKHLFNGSELLLIVFNYDEAQNFQRRRVYLHLICYVSKKQTKIQTAAEKKYSPVVRRVRGLPLTLHFKRNRKLVIPKFTIDFWRRWNSHNRYVRPLNPMTNYQFVLQLNHYNYTFVSTQRLKNYDHTKIHKNDKTDKIKCNPSFSYSRQMR